MQEMQDKDEGIQHKDTSQKNKVQEMRRKKLQGNQEGQSQVKRGKHEL